MTRSGTIFLLGFAFGFAIGEQRIVFSAWYPSAEFARSVDERRRFRIELNTPA